MDAAYGVQAQEQGIRGRLPAYTPIVTVWNKIDLGDTLAGERDGVVYVSALTGAGLDALREALKKHAGFNASAEGVFLARHRHLQALQTAGLALERAYAILSSQRAGELLAEELRAAQQALAAITGEFTSDDLLGRIFSSFCIGK